MKYFLILALSLVFAACSSRSIKPNLKDVEVSREAAKKDCREIGTITGMSASAKDDGHEKALTDLKREAANKGANYVVVKQYSGYGTAVTGIAYECP